MFVITLAAFMLKRLDLKVEHVEAFFTCMGGVQGPKFLSLVDEVCKPDPPQG
jgi:hypothetical protein